MTVLCFTTFTAEDIAAQIERIDAMLRDLGTPVHTGACKCSRCERHAPVQAAGSAPAPKGPEGLKVERVALLPTRPPAGAAVRAFDEITF